MEKNDKIRHRAVILPWSQGQSTQASLQGHGGHTWRGCPFVQHGKEVGWQIQTWQGEP